MKLKKEKPSGNIIDERNPQRVNFAQRGDPPGIQRSGKSDRELIMSEVNASISKELNDFVKGRRLPSRTYSK